jgi:hypothetical protein
VNRFWQFDQEHSNIFFPLWFTFLKALGGAALFGVLGLCGIWELLYDSDDSASDIEFDRISGERG